MRKNYSIAYILLIPTFIIIISFIYYPAFYTFKLSFHRMAPFGNRVIYVGLKNYIRLFQDPEYILSIKITFWFLLFTVSLGMLLSFLFALLLNEKVPGTRFYRTLIFAPYAISPAIAGTLWAFLLNPVVGHLNYILLKLFGFQVEWLTTRPYAFFSVAFATVWKNLAFGIIFYLAGLQSVPDDLIEAAMIDGANTFRRIVSIILPYLSPITFYLIIMNIISSMFASFGTIDVMTAGGPAGSTSILMYKLFLDAFTYSRTGAAAAQTVILFVFMVIVTIVYFTYGQRSVHYQ